MSVKLIECLNCHALIPEEAEKCPKCGVKRSTKKDKKQKTDSNVYTYTPGEYDVLADSTLEDKIEDFR